MKNLHEALLGVLKEAVDGNYVNEYHNKQQLDNYTLEIDFNYNFACGVAITNDDFGLYWSQYDNSLIYTTDTNEHDYIGLPKTENLTVSTQDLKSALANITLPEDFPEETFMDTIQDVCKHIDDNYDVYWKIWRKTYLTDADVAHSKDIDKQNVEFVQELFACFDKCCKHLGFTEDTEEVDEKGLLQAKSYIKKGNYTHMITYTTINPDCTLNYTVYNDKQTMQNIDFSNIVDCTDIEDVFKNHINSAVEGME